MSVTEIRTGSSQSRAGLGYPLLPEFREREEDQGRPRIQGNEGGRSSKFEKKYGVTRIIADVPVSTQARFDSPLTNNKENKSQRAVPHNKHAHTPQSPHVHHEPYACPGDIQVHTQTHPAAPSGSDHASSLHQTVLTDFLTSFVQRAPPKFYKLLSGLCGHMVLPPGLTWELMASTSRTGL